jgi:hypothetical protein
MTTFEKMALWHAAMRCAATIHTAAPGDLEALSAAGYIAHTVAPSFAEYASFAREHGLPAPDPEFHAAALAKFAELAALVVLAPETQH